MVKIDVKVPENPCYRKRFRSKPIVAPNLLYACGCAHLECLLLLVILASALGAAGETGFGIGVDEDIVPV